MFLRPEPGSTNSYITGLETGASAPVSERFRKLLLCQSWPVPLCRSLPLLYFRLPVGAQATLLKVKTAGRLACGIVREEPEYSNLDAHGNRALFDVDLCKAIAIAALGSDARFDVTAFPDEIESLKALHGGIIDVVASATPSLSNASSLGLRFGRTMLFDYQGLMINTAMSVHTADDLAGKKICYLTETNIEAQPRQRYGSAEDQVHPFSVSGRG